MLSSRLATSIWLARSARLLALAVRPDSKSLQYPFLAILGDAGFSLEVLELWFFFTPEKKNVTLSDDRKWQNGTLA